MGMSAANKFSENNEITRINFWFMKIPPALSTKDILKGL
jgi:hypothetical protein